MPFVSKQSRASRRKRLTCGVAVIALCTLTGACSNDDPPVTAKTTSPTEHSAANPGDPSITALPADSAPATLTIQTPAAPASEAGTAVSAASPPLASPVIHTVD